jgi:Rhodanese-like domain
MNAWDSPAWLCSSRLFGREDPVVQVLQLLVFTLAFGTGAQADKKVDVDPQTGRAIGAREMTPGELKKLIDAHGKVLIIDVREPAAFEKETIKGAINIPIGQLEARLKDIPKDTTLVFT